MEALVAVLRRTQSLRELTLTDNGLKCDFLLQFALALQTNSTIPLHTLRLTQQTFDDHKGGDSVSLLKISI